MIGARRAGKTALLRHELATTHACVSLEHPDVRAERAAEPRASPPAVDLGAW